MFTKNVHGTLFLSPVCVLVAAAGAHAQTTHYVDDDGTSITCTSWADACPDLQTALGLAGTGDQIWVAVGTYKPTSGTDRTATFQLITGVAIYGGFDGTESTLAECAGLSDQTILSGDIGTTGDNSDNSYHVVTGSGTGATAVLDGFTITGGYASASSPHDCGGGMYNDAGSPTVSHCTFSANTAATNGGGMANLYRSNPTVTGCTFSDNAAYRGGGMCSDSSKPTVTACDFSANAAGLHGGGMSVVGTSSPDVRGCRFVGNTAGGHGGGLLSSSTGVPRVTGCTFNANDATGSGGGICLVNSSPEVRDCNLAGNSADKGGGMANINEHSLPTVTNCTFSGNSADMGGGMANYNNSNPVVTNCILWGDTAVTAGHEVYNDVSAPVINYSDVQGGYGGTGNIADDPLFVDADGPDDTFGTEDDNLRLQGGSPCIDVGSNAAVTVPTDLDGNPRVWDGDGDEAPIVDMGAYEYFADDCNHNGMPDLCDIDCSSLDGACNVEGCGSGGDCNGNSFPDECDVDASDPDGNGLVSGDCNDNGIPDECDVDASDPDGNGEVSSDCNANGVPDSCEMPDYDIGAIHTQTVWHGGTVAFLLHSSEQGPGATFSIVADPQPFGPISIDPMTGCFSYTPAAEDKRAFTVTFTATWGGAFVSQDVQFEPMPRLPDEADVLGLDPVHPVPDPESRDYIIVNVVESDEPEDFNWESRSTRKVAISGKTVVFEQGHPHGLYDYHHNADIRELTVFAETVVVRSALHFPQTDVTIHAKTLRFEDDPDAGVWASIDTTPLDTILVPDPTADGAPGLKAGDIRLYLQRIEAEPGLEPRFILRGGKGQRSGPGEQGTNGDDMPTIPDSSMWEYCWNSPACDEDLVVGAKYCLDQYCFSPAPWPLYWGGWTSGSGPCTVWPGDGEPGIAGGKPGDGGQGGYVVSNVFSLPDADCQGGDAGQIAAHASGGMPGTPEVSAYAFGYGLPLGAVWRMHVCGPHHVSQPGPSTPGPPADLPVGLPGAVVQAGNAWSWLSPDGVRMILAHAKDAYLYGHLDYAENVLREYRDLLETYRETGAWQALSPEWQLEFTQLLQEMRILLHRLENNLDYFGNPAGWVPMLSFEVNQAAFAAEVDRAIRSLYLAYWVGNAERDLQAKVDALQTARTELQDEIEDFREDYGTLIDLIPTLREDANNLAFQIEQLLDELQRLEQRLVAEAAHNVAVRNRWKLFCRILGGITKLIPVRQPTLGLVGQGLNELTDALSPETPWPTIAEQEDVATEFLNAADPWESALNEIDEKGVSPSLR